MLSLFKRLWNKLLNIFKGFIDIAIPAVTQAILAELKDVAVSIVESLQNTDLTNSQKREEAFGQIKDAAIKKGKDISSSLINLLIEIALQYIKNKVV